MSTLDFQADGTDGIYADKQAEAALKERGHSLHFYRHGEGSCWYCGRHAKLAFSNPAEKTWTLSGAAFDESCEWESIPFYQVREGDFLSQHSVNGATYGPPMKIDRITKTQMIVGEKGGRLPSRYSRTDGKLIGPMTSFYASVVRKKEGQS